MVSELKFAGGHKFKSINSVIYLIIGPLFLVWHIKLTIEINLLIEKIDLIYSKLWFIFLWIWLQVSGIGSLPKAPDADHHMDLWFFFVE